MGKIYIDKKDILILIELSKNSRQQYTKIAKKINLTSESVKNRIYKLKEKNIIKAYKTNINFSKLGFLEYDILIKLKNYNQFELNQIIKFIVNYKNTTWVGTCFGPYDLRISIIIQKIEEINEFLTNFKKNFKKNFLDYKLLFLLEKIKISQEKIIYNLFNIKKYTLQNKKKIIKNNVIKKEKIFNLDEIDKKIIENLNNKTDISLVELSKNIKLTPESCKYRINKLKKEKIILSTSIIIDGNKLNKIWAVFLFKLDDENQDELINFIKNTNNVSSFVHMIGDYNYSISVFADNVQDIHITLMNFRNKFPEIIKEYELILIFETFKYPSIPKIIFET